MILTPETPGIQEYGQYLLFFRDDKLQHGVRVLMIDTEKGSMEYLCRDETGNFFAARKTVFGQISILLKPNAPQIAQEWFATFLK